MTALNLARAGAVHLRGEACRACLAQVRDAREPDADPDAPPHARLMVTSSTPVIEAFGGGVQTRYVCLDCGHCLTHATGRFGQGWR